MSSVTTAKAESTALCKGVDYLQRTVYAFNKLSAPQNGRTIPLFEALQLIQESPQSPVVVKGRKHQKGSPGYQRAKHSVTCFSYNVSLYRNHYRTSDNALELSGLMYFDRDEAGDIQELSVIPELVCSWTSFGGKGEGFIVAVEGLTVHNFKSTWKALYDRFKDFGVGVNVDKSCSNIDRPNVLSYSDVLLADTVTPFQAVEPLPKFKPLPVVNPLQDADETYTRLKKGLANKGVYYVDGNRNDYIVALAGACNRCGIAQADAEAWIAQDLEYAATHVPAEEIRKKVRGIYKSFASDFGIRPFEKSPLYNYSRKKKEEPKKPALCAPMPSFGAKSILTFSSFPLNKTSKCEYTQAVEHKLLNPGQYLADLKLDFRKSQYVDSGPGTGKTAATIRSGVAFDLLVPTQDQAKQIGHEYGIDYVSEGRQPTEKAQQVGTYNALQKFLQRDTSGRTLVIDEAHNTALSQGYRSSVLNEMLDQAAKYHNVVFLSGTPIKSSHPLYKNIPVTRIRRAEAQHKEVEVVRYRDKETSLIKRLERGKLQTIVLQDKNKGQDLATLLRGKGYAVQCFNAETKEEDQHREIIEHCTVNEGIEVLIVTGLFFEGININNTNIGAVHLLSRLSRYHIAQLFERYRKKAPEKLIQYRPVTADINQDVSFDWDEQQAHYLSCAESFVKAQQVHTLPETGAAQVADDILKGLQGDLKHLTRFTDRWQVNYLGVDYLTVQAETKAMHRNINLFEELLSEYGFYLSGIVEDTEAEPEHQLQDIARTRKTAQEARQTALIELFEQGGMGYVLEAAKSRDADEAQTANRVLELEKYVPFLQALELLKKPLSDSKYILLRDQARAQKYLQCRAKEDLTTPETRMLDTIYNLFKENETITPEEAKDRLNKIRNQHFRTKHMILSPNEAVRVLKQFFEVERTTRYNEGKENCYRILSTNPLNINLQGMSMAA